MSPGERERRAIQPRNTAERRSADNGAARRASGQAMIERRTGQSQADDINALVKQPRQQRSLRTVEPRGALAPQRGTGSYVAPPASSGGGGIASPLTVQKIQYSEEPTYVATFDASGYFAVKKIDLMIMTDADGQHVIVQGFDMLDENGNPKPETPDGG